MIEETTMARSAGQALLKSVATPYVLERVFDAINF